MMSRTYPEELIFSGGNFATLSFLGSVQSLIDKDKLKLEKVKRYIGTSGGAVISFLLAIGYLPTRILNIVNKIPINEVSKLSSDKYLDFFDKYGIHDTAAFKKLLCLFLEHIKWPRNLTFRDLFQKKDIDLNFTSYCLNTSSLVILNHKNTPELKILDGVCMSMAVPFLFYPVSYQNRLYVDAFLVCNHPVEFSEHHDSSLSFCLRKHEVYVEDISLLKYLKIIMNSPVKKIEHLELGNYKGKTVYVSCDYDFDASFDITEDVILQFYNCGYSSIDNNDVNAEDDLDVEDDEDVSQDEGAEDINASQNQDNVSQDEDISQDEDKDIDVDDECRLMSRSSIR